MPKRQVSPKSNKTKKNEPNRHERIRHFFDCLSTPHLATIISNQLIYNSVPVATGLDFEPTAEEINYAIKELYNSRIDYSVQ